MTGRKIKTHDSRDNNGANVGFKTELKTTHMTGLLKTEPHRPACCFLTGCELLKQRRPVCERDVGRGFGPL